MPTLNFGPCSKRSLLMEWTDTPNINEEELIQAFEFWESTERLCNGTGIILDFMKKLIRQLPENQAITVLDLFCGRGTLSRTLASWAAKKNIELKIMAVDRFPRIIELAKECAGGPSKILFEVRDWTDSSFLQAQQFDVVISSLGLHHLTASEVGPFLKMVNLVAKHGFIVNDWIRDLRAWFWMKSLVRFYKNDTARHDGPLSIRKGFTSSELRGLCKRSGLEEAVIKKHLGYRFSISSVRALAFSRELVPTPA